MHDSGCYPYSIIGGSPTKNTGIDERTGEIKMENISFAGREEKSEVKLGDFYGKMYKEDGELLGWFRLMAMYVPTVTGIFLANSDCRIIEDKSGSGPYKIGLGDHIFDLNPDSTIRGYIVRMSQREIEDLQSLNAITLRSGTELPDAKQNIASNASNAANTPNATNAANDANEEKTTIEEEEDEMVANMEKTREILKFRILLRICIAD